MSGKLKFLAGLNVAGWTIVVPLLVASLLDPFVDFSNWPGGFVVDSRGGATRLAEVESSVRSARSSAGGAAPAIPAPAVALGRAVGPAGTPVLSGTIVTTPRRTVRIDTSSRSGLRRQARNARRSGIRAPQRSAPALPPAAPAPTATTPVAAAASAPARRPGRGSQKAAAPAPTRSAGSTKSVESVKRVFKRAPKRVLPPAKGPGNGKGPDKEKPAKPVPQAVEAPKVDTPAGPDEDKGGGPKKE